MVISWLKVCRHAVAEFGPGPRKAGIRRPFGNRASRLTGTFARDAGNQFACEFHSAWLTTRLDGFINFARGPGVRASFRLRAARKKVMANFVVSLAEGR
jgi:hypothetical protein